MGNHSLRFRRETFGGFLAAAIVASLCGGCFSTTATEKRRPPDAAALVLTINPPAGGIPVDTSAGAAGRPIDEVIAWVEPADITALPQQPGGISIDLTTPSSRIIPAPIGAIWAFQNPYSPPVDVRLRAENGRITDLGTVPGSGLSLAPGVTGLFDVLSGTNPNPIAHVFVAPSIYVGSARFGQPMTFLGLPAGKATITWWHPALPGGSSSVKLKPDQTATLTLTAGASTPKPH